MRYKIVGDLVCDVFFLSYKSWVINLNLRGFFLFFLFVKCIFLIEMIRGYFKLIINKFMAFFFFFIERESMMLGINFVLGLLSFKLFIYDFFYLFYKVIGY